MKKRKLLLMLLCCAYFGLLISCGSRIQMKVDSYNNPDLNLSGLYSPKLASFLELLPTLRYPAACCGEVHYFRV
jgi:hypothetical protein